MPKKGDKLTEEHKRNIKKKLNTPDVKKKMKTNRADFSGKNNGMWVEKIEWTCPVCGSIKMLTPCAAAKRQFCSKKCAVRGENNGMYGKKAAPHKPDCTCAFCKAKRGELIGDKNPMFGKKSAPHKIDCQCSFCKAKRGEYKGKNNPWFGQDHSGKYNGMYKRTGNKASSWKGDAATKGPMHRWVEKNKGKASEHKCIDCGKQAYHWSNVNNHVYRRKLDDYIPRCSGCHQKYDNTNRKIQKQIELLNLLKEVLNISFVYSK